MHAWRGGNTGTGLFAPPCDALPACATCSTPAGKALEANPSDPAVLLSLGVSHTNELDQAEAVGHLAAWLRAHPEYGPAAAAAGPPPESSQLLSHTLRTFAGLAASHKGDAELAIATGVLQHLARDYDGAIRSFR
jgi:peroxin-5